MLLNVSGLNLRTVGIKTEVITGLKCYTEIMLSACISRNSHLLFIQESLDSTAMKSSDLDLNKSDTFNESEFKSDELTRRWFTLLLGYPPILEGGRMASKVLDLGVARSTEQLTMPKYPSLYLFTLLHCTKQVRGYIFELANGLEIENVSPSDSVVLANELTFDQLDTLVTTISGMKCDVLHWILDTSRVVKELIVSPNDVDAKRWRWSPVMHQFFDSPQFRGIRRRAARKNGVVFANRVSIKTPFWISQLKSFTFSKGLAYFVAEWGIAVASASNGLTTASKCSEILRTIDVWLKQHAGNEMYRWWGRETRFAFTATVSQEGVGG
jgi:hypothetical protein